MVWCHPIFMLIRRSYPDTEYFKASSDLTPQPVAANNLLHPPLVTGGVTHGSRSLRNPAAVAHPLHARPQWPIRASSSWRSVQARAHGSPWCQRGPHTIAARPAASPIFSSLVHRIWSWRGPWRFFNGASSFLLASSADLKAQYRRQRVGGGLPLLEAEDGGRHTIARCLPFACGSWWWCSAAYIRMPALILLPRYIQILHLKLPTSTDQFNSRSRQEQWRLQSMVLFSIWVLSDIF